MSFFWRCTVVALGSFGLATVVSSIAVAAVWWWRTPQGSAAERADWLLRLRLLPSVFAVSLCTFALVGLVRFEPRDTDETLGWVLHIAAGLGAALLAATAVRLIRMHRETGRLLNSWLARAVPLELPRLTIPAYRIATAFPVVALVGILRPKLVVAGSVLDACSEEELAAILAHEQGHLRRGDNLRRALFSSSPDLLSWTPITAALGRAWREATEEAADDAAAESGRETRVHLASALVRVARLAPASDCHRRFRESELPASALFRGESIERRVRRLCEAPAHAGHRDLGLWRAAVVLAAAALFAGQQRIHDVMEVVIALLP